VIDDGNYSGVRDLVWSRADTVIWLDLPRWTTMRQVIWRTVRRLAGRTELWNGNRERWANLLSLDPEESVIAYSWHKHRACQERYVAATADPRWAGLRFIRLRSRSGVNRLLHAELVQ
jgi:adenylate kinase family enzyme